MLLETPVTRRTTVEEAAQLARKLYSIEAVGAPLPGEYDENFHLTARDGHEFVLKVMHPARDRGFIDMQCRALQHLAAHAPDLDLPRVIPSSAGETVTEIAATDGQTRFVWMLTFLRGAMLARVR